MPRATQRATARQAARTARYTRRVQAKEYARVAPNYTRARAARRAVSQRTQQIKELYEGVQQAHHHVLRILRIINFIGKTLESAAIFKLIT